jgi:hypothetical protein
VARGCAAIVGVGVRCWCSPTYRSGHEAYETESAKAVTDPGTDNGAKNDGRLAWIAERLAGLGVRRERTTCNPCNEHTIDEHPITL